ncbi:hypothetical protein ASZ78_007047 [Callipepla squamata]|uniref:Peptidase S54 rhomboid domain-containing protein n=1 Tax=Callipepla squamata TaxID=9009 RepID=A0A226MQX5_CALSU|nr:hypothetical protein ASZ78_007047 [Callipepla squamata]
MAAGRGRPLAAVAVTVLLSLGASGPGLLRGSVAAHPGALRPAAVRAGEVHRLVTYVFVYEDLISLTCGAVVIWYFAGSFEKNVGTVKHCFFTIVFAILTGLLYLLLEAVVSRVSEVEDAKGFMPIAFATLESVASKLDRMFPFSVLKRIPGLKYIPGSSAERRASESSKKKTEDDVPEDGKQS